MPGIGRVACLGLAAVLTTAPAATAQRSVTQPNVTTLVPQQTQAEQLRQWRVLAERGNAEALFNLGNAHRLGRGVPRDLDAAEAFYARAARNNHVEAQGLHGLMLIERGAAEEGLAEVERAARRGDARAQYVLGTALFYGDGLIQDRPRALALMAQSAASGFPLAQNQLTEMQQEMAAASALRSPVQSAPAGPATLAEAIPAPVPAPAELTPAAPPAPVADAAPAIAPPSETGRPAAALPPVEAAASQAGSSLPPAEVLPVATPPAAEITPPPVRVLAAPPAAPPAEPVRTPAEASALPALAPAEPPVAHVEIATAASAPTATELPSFPVPTGAETQPHAPRTAPPEAATSTPAEAPPAPTIAPETPQAAADPAPTSARAPATRSLASAESPAPEAESAPTPAEIDAALARAPAQSPTPAAPPAVAITAPPPLARPQPAPAAVNTAQLEAAAPPVEPAPTPDAPAPMPLAGTAAPPPAQSIEARAEASAADPTPPATGGWRLQLGAFRVEGGARRAWQELGPLLPGLQPVYARQGELTLLQAGPLPDRAAARRACAVVRGAGQQCLPWGPPSP